MDQDKLKDAIDTISKIDLSKLPFNMKLEIVSKEEISENLLPSVMKSLLGPTHAIRLFTIVPDRNSGIVSEFYTHRAINDISNFAEEALNLVIQFMEHETREWFLVNGKRLFDPHLLGQRYIVDETGPI